MHRILQKLQRFYCTKSCSVTTKYKRNNLRLFAKEQLIKLYFKTYWLDSRNFEPFLKKLAIVSYGAFLQVCTMLLIWTIQQHPQIVLKKDVSSNEIQRLSYGTVNFGWRYRTVSFHLLGVDVSSFHRSYRITRWKCWYSHKEVFNSLFNKEKMTFLSYIV